MSEASPPVEQWIGEICRTPTAARAGRSAVLADHLTAIVEGSINTVEAVRDEGIMGRQTRLLPPICEMLSEPEKKEAAVLASPPPHALAGNVNRQDISCKRTDRYGDARFGPRKPRG